MQKLKKNTLLMNKSSKTLHLTMFNDTIKTLRRDYKMSDMGENIKYLREKADLTQEEFASKMGVQKSAVSKWERGMVQNMKRDVIEQIASFFEVNPSALMGWDNLEPTPHTEYKLVPVFGSVACGEPLEAFNDVIDYATIPASWLNGGKEYLCLTAKGDSMAPTIESGDLAVIRKQSDCENGQICAVFVNGYNATLKKVFKSKDVITLQPINPNYEPQVFTGKELEEIQILGVMVELRKIFI